MKTKFFEKFSKALIGLQSSECVKNLSGKERRTFFEALGFLQSLVYWLLLVAIVIVDCIWGNKDVHNSFYNLVIVWFAVPILSWIIKYYWKAYPLYVFEHEAVGCKFRIKRDIHSTAGFVIYNDQEYRVENFELTKADELFWFHKQIFPELHAMEMSPRPRSKEVLLEGCAEDFFPDEDRVVKLYYDTDKCNRFFERTEVKGEVYKSYEVISWIFFGVHFLMDFALPVGYLIIALKNCC